MPNRIFRPALFLVSLMIALLPHAAKAESLQLLRAAYVDFPPLSYTDKAGNPAGEGIELTNKVAKEAGFRLEWQEFPIGRIYHSFRNDLIDLWPGSSGVPAIQEYTLETKKAPGWTLRLYAYHLEPNPAVDAVELIRDKRLILVRGYTYLNKLDAIRERNADVVVAPNHRSALKLLTLGRGDYLLGFGRPLEEAAEAVPVSGLQRSLLDEWRISFVVSKKLPEAQKVVEKLDEAYLKLTGDQCEPAPC